MHAFNSGSGCAPARLGGGCGSVRCDAVGKGLFSAVALEMDPGNRIFTTLPGGAVFHKSFVFSFLPIRKVLVLTFRAVFPLEFSTDSPLLLLVVLTT